MPKFGPPPCLWLVPRLAAVLALGAVAPAQGNWTRQAPMPTSSDLRAVALVSATELWACGGEGELVHTRDAGATWELDTLNTNSIWALDFVDAQHGWAAGNGFFHTTNGGQTWVQDNNWGSIYDLHFVDTQRGWACGNGGVTYRTTNGGQSWVFRSVGTITTLSSIWFVDASNGWTLDIDGRIYESVDGGANWTLRHDANEYLSTIQFFDLQEGWAIGGDTFLHTIDGGQTWTRATVPAGTWSHAARFSDRQHGISVGQSGNVVITSDAGQTWTTVPPVTTDLLWDVESWSPTVSVWAGSAGSLARTTDGGASWSPIQSGGSGATHGLDAVDTANAWAANDGGEVLRTTNGGALWLPVAVAGFDQNGHVEAVDFVDTARGWAVGRHYDFGAGAGRIARSIDGGRHWTLQLDVPGGEFYDVVALDAQTVLAAGRTASFTRTILRTTDAGQTWVNVAPGSSIYSDFDFVDSARGWVVGSRIHTTSDGGQTWTQQLAAAPDTLLSVSFADAANGWAVGWSTTVLHTTDGGATWTPQQANAPAFTNALFEVQALSPTQALICGGNGFFARTENGGQTWVREIIPGVTGTFEAMFALDAERTWLGGPGIWYSGPPADTGTVFCSGDGSATACPCGNAGAPSNGCASSVNAAGAHLGSTGASSLAADSLVLRGSGMPNSSCLYIQGTTQQSGGAGITFGDGLRCVGGNILRLGTKSNLNGASEYPGIGDPSVSVRGLVGAPGTRTYQIWYRNSAAFCTPAPFNVSNGLAVTWTL